MKNKEIEREIIPIKIEIDTDTEIRACNFHGPSKTGTKYITPQLVFVRAVGRNKSIDISFNIKQIPNIIEHYRFAVKMRITSNACEDINRLNNLFMFRYKEDRKRGSTS